MNDKNSSGSGCSPIAFIAGVVSAMVGYNVNVHLGSSMPLFWAMVDLFFWPFAWAKWLICHQVTWPIIRETFSFFSA